MPRRMWWTILVLVSGVACTKPNPLFCCATEQQCAAAGADELRPCPPGQACAESNSCVAEECETSAECHDPSRPTCQVGFCVPGCINDSDCLGISDRPHCDNAACVACITNEQCSPDAAICDGETRTCRGCIRDSDCDSDLCVEAEGRCASTTEALFVEELAGVDKDPCSKSAPCKTIEFASSRVDNVRHIIKLVGSTLAIGRTVMLGAATIIDGSNTELRVGPLDPALIVQSGVVIEGVKVDRTGNSSARVVQVEPLGELRLKDVRVEDGTLTLRGGRLTFAI